MPHNAIRTIFFLLLLATGAAAQTPQAVGVALSAENRNSVQSELLFGQNTKGPYLLGWKGIRANSETVLRDGLYLARDKDYTIAPDSGILAFTEPIKNGQTVRVSYRIDTPEAAENPVTPGMPLSMELFRSGSNRVIFQTQLNMAKGSGTQTAQTATPGMQYFGGLRFAKNADLTTGVFLDLRGGDWMARSGLNLAQKTTFKNAEFGFGYTRTGADFAQQKASGLTPGREQMEANGAFQLAQGLMLTSSLRQMTDLRSRIGHEDDPDFSPIGDVTRQYGANLVYTMAALGKIEGGRTQSLLVAPDGSQTLTTSDAVKVERSLDKRTQVSAGFESQATDADKTKPGNENYAQSTAVGVTTRPAEGYTLSGNYRNTIGTAGVSDAANFNMEATPFQKYKELRLRTSWGDQFQAGGARRTREAMVDLPRLRYGDVKLSGGFRQFQRPGQERVTGVLDASFRPARSVQISGGLRLRDGKTANSSTPDPNAEDTYDVKMAYSPLRSLRLTGNYTLNPGMEDTIRRAQQQAFGLETDIGSATLRGRYGTESEALADRLSQMYEVGLDLRFSRYTTLTTSWLESSQFGDAFNLSNTFAFGLRHDLGSRFNFNLGGSVTTFGQNGAVDPSKTEIRGEAKLGVKF